ncbi:MAG: hypothetical protein AAF267_19795 [Deinococcota bacterium]
MIERKTFKDFRPSLDKFQMVSLIVGVGGLGFCLVGAIFGLEQFFQSYLYGFIFWLGIALGCLILLLLQNIAGGPWGPMIRRPLEAGVTLIPIMGLFFIPILAGMGYLYEWTNPDVIAANEIIASKTAYLNVPFFIVRALIYFAIWIGISYLLVQWSEQQDNTNDPKVAEKMRNFSAPGLISFILTMTFAAFDWGMSLTPEWFSGMYGVIFMIGQAISAVAFMIIIMTLFGHFEPLASVANPKRIQDLGNFLMAFTMFWAYVSASQLIIIWSNNVVETNSWYVLRLNGFWGWIGAALLLFHFASPFLILFSRWVKQKVRALVIIACWMLFMRLVDIFWLIVPTYERNIPFSLLDAAVLVGIGGVWLSIFVSRLKNKPLLPLHDPRLASDHG